METGKGLIFDIRKYSIHDGPGIRTAVFFKGCPLSCLWCHNPESQSAAPELVFWSSRCTRCGKCIEACARNAVYEEEGAYYTLMEHCTLCGDCLTVCQSDAREIAGKYMSVAEVMTVIEQDIPFYDESGGGVTFSGGEPLMQRSFLMDLLRACKEKELNTALDTCGFATWDTLDCVRPYVDLFLYDIKLIDEQRHKHFTGVSNHLILSNLKQLSQLGHQIVIRVPLIPGITDDEENLQAIGSLAASLPGVLRVDLLPYHNTAVQKYNRLGRDYQLAGMTEQPEEKVSQSAHLLATYDLKVNIGG